ncbi:PREDICTED: signal peptide, CUB and EGF-like domain-containing protein 2 [Branchiostoma belcheri]|uniref:Signal peptide, CUB and EGF-like domain-containing protein 2 n=1 Tax=Branchiostoma belcheri TaxID=7741 RepID=A0A6P5B0G3_BRABE|nr:PREDICTED: signal peptide, CUB and EGF-like domain-containing protein 2 [Branchiostoma belcheri]
MRQLVLTAFLLGSLAMASASDVDECASNNGGCAHTCTNSVGSFSCSCRAGYVLNADGLACDENPGLEPASNFGDYQGYRIWSSDRHQRLSYSDARDVCRINGGTLVMIKDSAKQTFIVDHLKKESTQGGRARRFWIGLDDLNDENVFLWNDGTPLGAFDSFQSTAPHTIRDCVTLSKKARRAPRWDIKPCTNSYSYICQMDFDACLSNPCDVNAVCTDNPAPALDATCTCKAGYEGDGTSCSDIDACLSTSCDVNAVCTDNPAPALDATCNCNAGYEGDGTSCSDIDECASNNGGCAHTCTNNVGSFSCSCRAGYVLNNDGFACDDDNECSRNNGGCQRVCTNTEGSFICSCNGQEELNADGFSCDGKLGLPLPRRLCVCSCFAISLRD